MITRRYTPEELSKHFDDRDYFRSMTSDQVTNILGYLEAKYKMNASDLAAVLLTGEDHSVVEMSDGAVYTHLQQQLEQQPIQDNAYYETQAQILVKSYRKMCREHGYNFKQPMHTVMDFGTKDGNMQFHMRREFYAKSAIGVEVEKYRLDECAEPLSRLRELQDDQVDLINCDSILHSVTDQSMKPVLDQFIRVCKKYLIIKDFELGEDYDIMKQFAITRELASGVLLDSDIPECILADEDGIADPASFYNQEFSISRVIQYLTSEAFEIVAQPKLRKSVGNPRIYILKRVQFTPWKLGQNNWNSDASKSSQMQEISKLKSKLFKDARGLKGKALRTPVRDLKQQQVTQLLNKISSTNYEEIIQRLVSVFSDTFQTVSVEEREEFVNGITTRLFSRAKTCRNMGEMFARIYKNLSETEVFVSGTSFIHSQVQKFCLDFIATVIQQLDPQNKETYEELSAQVTCVTSFVGESLRAGVISTETIIKVVTDLNQNRPAGNAEYMKSILSLIEILSEQNPGIHSELGIDLERIAATETGRLRCIVLNAIDCLKALEQERSI